LLHTAGCHHAALTGCGGRVSYAKGCYCTASPAPTPGQQASALPAACGDPMRTGFNYFLDTDYADLHRLAVIDII